MTDTDTDAGPDVSALSPGDECPSCSRLLQEPGLYCPGCHRWWDGSEELEDTPDAGPTGGEWDWSPQDGPPGHCIQAQVWGPDGDSIAAIDSLDGEEVANDRARLIAAAGRAAHELPDEYDPVEAIQMSADLWMAVRQYYYAATRQDKADALDQMCHLFDALPKARRNDE